MMTERLAAAGFALDAHGVWSRVDDVYVTTVSEDEREGWMVSETNLDAPSERATVRFRLAEDGTVIDTDGTIDVETAMMTTSDLRER